MKTRVTLQFIGEAERFDLRYTCDDCGYFVSERCAHGYPRGERKRALTVDEHIEFCKEFEAR